MNYNQTKQTTVKWKRFSGASYASFQSLHREIRIGVLTVAMLSSAGLKAENLSEAEVWVPAGDTLKEELLEDVEVLATRVSLTAEQTPRLVTVLRATDIAAAAVQSINDLLEYAVGVDVRQRGEYGVQTDISVRGGNFDQLTVLLNGVNISSPHTGHLTADFPVTVQDIERIEVLEGPAARVFGTSAFTGVINIVTRRPEALHGEVLSGAAHLYGGSYGYAGGDLSLGSSLQLQPETTLSNHLAGGYSRSDGATPNSDFGATRLFFHGSLQHHGLKLDGQLGYSYKDYGANTFYGVSSTDQWESNERLIASLQLQTPLGQHWELMAGTSWNRWYDHYQWHRDVSPGGENFHKVDAAAGHINLAYKSAYGRTSIGYELRHEGIYSTSLGQPLDTADWVPTAGHDANDGLYYKKKDSRQNHNLYFEHDVLLRQWTLSLGLLANRNTGLDSDWRLYPGIDISYRPTTAWRLFASWNMALRMPTFTDLYYNGANIIGNQDLKPEKTTEWSLGTRYRASGWRLELQAFYSHKTDMIDWVIWANEPDGKTYRSTNFSLRNLGVETQFTWLPSEWWEDCPLRRLNLQWAYINEDSEYDSPIKASKYAMMYLRHKVVAQADVRLGNQLNLSTSWRLMDRVGQQNPTYALLDMKLQYDARRFNLYCGVTNLLNKQYFEYEFIRQPGRLFNVGLKLKR